MEKEERESIINEAVEKALLKLPDVFANLALDHKLMSIVTSKFYRDNPEFIGNEISVIEAVAEIDGKNPALNYEEKLVKAIPLIKEKIALVKMVDLKTVNENPDRSLSGNGEI